jgi:hypothetical protein
MAGQDHDLPYRIEVWDQRDAHVEELIALVGDHAVARAAFEEAIRRRLGRIITLQQKSQVLAESKGLASSKD